MRCCGGGNPDYGFLSFFQKTVRKNDDFRLCLEYSISVYFLTVKISGKPVYITPAIHV